MKPIYVVLFLLFGILFFALGCMADSIIIEGFGACLLFVGVVPVLGKIWPEPEHN